MPKIIATFKCKECEDVFEATSDSYSICKCGKSEVKPSLYSTSYKSDSGVNFEKLEYKKYYSEDEFIILDEEAMDVWNKIKEFKFEGYNSYFYAHQFTEKSDNGVEYLSSLHANTYDYTESDERNEIELNIELQKDMTRYTLDEVKRGLEKFYEFISNVKDGRIDLKNRSDLKEIANGWKREQREIYDYAFYF